MPWAEVEFDLEDYYNEIPDDDVIDMYNSRCLWRTGDGASKTIDDLKEYNVLTYDCIFNVENFLYMIQHDHKYHGIYEKLKAELNLV
jgi:hypothetical protein